MNNINQSKDSLAVDGKEFAVKKKILSSVLRNVATLLVILLGCFIGRVILVTFALVSEPNTLTTEEAFKLIKSQCAGPVQEVTLGVVICGDLRIFNFSYPKVEYKGVVVYKEIPFNSNLSDKHKELVNHGKRNY